MMIGRKCFLSAIAVTFILAVITLPGLSHANITATGTASVSWDSIAVSNLAGLDWTMMSGFDTRGSFSGVQGWVGDPSLPDWVGTSLDGLPWGNTAVSQTLPLGAVTPIVTESASTNITPGVAPNTTQTAYGLVDMTTPGIAGADISQGVLSGQFTLGTFNYNPIDPLTGLPAINPTTGLPGVFVPGTVATLLDIFLDYTLGISLFNDLSGAYSTAASASVGITLEDFDTGAVYASDTRALTQTLVGMGSYSNSAASTPGPPSTQLHLSYLLQPGVNYNFEVQASTTASVPEPASLILLISGLVGIGIFRRRVV